MRPRCILCYRCVRACDEGMGVKALGVSNRGVIAEIVPNHHDHLECDECGACIDICPVGALTSGTYRYQTRPWEMNHVGTICTHCADGCRTTLGVRNDKIIRGNNRDHSGINGEFLCVKGRYAFDFVEHPDRLQSPDAAQWAISSSPFPGRTRSKSRPRNSAPRNRFGVIGSNHTTNEENYFLAKMARQGSEDREHRSSPHRRSGDAVRCALRQKRRPRDYRRPLQRESDSDRRRRPFAAASFPRLSGPREFPPSCGAHLRRHVRPGARRSASRGQRPRPKGRRDRGCRIPARQIERRIGAGHRLRRRDSRRRRPQAGRIRRFARRARQIRLPGRLFELARRLRHGRRSEKRRHVG